MDTQIELLAPVQHVEGLQVAATSTHMQQEGGSVSRGRDAVPAQVDVAGPGEIPTTPGRTHIGIWPWDT